MKTITAALVCAAILPLGPFARGDAPSGTEGENVWTLTPLEDGSASILSKGNWQFEAAWWGNNILRISSHKAGEGVLDWDDIVLRKGDETISDLGVQIGFCALASAPITEFYCNKVESMGTWGVRANKTIERVRASGPRLTTLSTECFSNCPKLTTVKLDFPNLRTIDVQAFANCTSLKADVTDILNPAVTNIDYMAFYNVKGLSGDLVLTNIQTIGGSAFIQTGLTSLHLAGPLSTMDAVFYACDAITNATFDLAEDVTTGTSFWGGPGAPFERIRFLRKPFGAESMTNLIGFVKGLTDPKACQIRVSRQQWPLEERQACGWWWPATKEGGLSDEELAAKPDGCLGYAEGAPTDWPVMGAKRRAWIVHEPSPYDKAGFIIRIR